MWKLEPPPFAAITTYETCARNIKDASLKKKFDDARSDVVLADVTYRESALSSSLDSLDPSKFVLPGLSTKEVVDLYDRRMAAQRSAGREIYDSIRISSRNGKCPLCGHREVMTLDHYLPKSYYPALAVNPINLIPACSDCNRTKSALTIPTLHPYYDDIEKEVWLYAEVVETTPAAARFYVACPQSWPQRLSLRVASHFKAFKLDFLYASQAARAISGHRHLLNNLFESGGQLLVRRHLEDQADTWRSHELNCWESALYTGLAGSDWFCRAGFRKSE